MRRLWYLIKFLFGDPDKLKRNLLEDVRMGMEKGIREIKEKGEELPTLDDVRTQITIRLSEDKSFAAACSLTRTTLDDIMKVAEELREKYK